MYKKLIYIVFVSFLFSCNSDENDLTDGNSEIPQQLSLPQLQTDEISDINLYSAKMGGKLINSGDSDVTEIGIIVGLSTLPTIESNLNKFVLTPDDSGNFNVTISDIPVSTNYYIRAYGINSDGVGYGNEVEFTSLDENLYVGNVILSTQQEVIDFGSNNYSRIDGNLSISGTVTDLTPLASLVIIDNIFEVKSTSNLQNLQGLNSLRVTGNTNDITAKGFYIENNTALQSLTGLNNLVRTRGNAQIINNDNLLNLEGLNKYTAASVGDLRIQDCDQLQSLSGLESFTFIGGDFFLMNNPQLNDLSSLSNLNFIGFGARIINNYSLQSLDGFESLLSIDILEIHNNDNLTNMDGLGNLTDAYSISIKYNDILNDLTAFQNITNVEYLSFEDNSLLTNLNGFQSLTSIGNRLFIFQNPNLISLNGLENLSSLQRLYINTNDSLLNLNGLNSLSTIMGSSYPIVIGNNSNLTSLMGLESLAQVEGFIQIVSNSILNDFCALKPLFSNGTHTGGINFSGNLSNPTVNDVINSCD